MKLVMTLLVRDEIDIIAANIDFHLSRGVDFFIATDNRSKDGTTEVLKGYERRGLLHYLYEPGDSFSQHSWVTRMARIAHAEFGADWVINNDADEFWYPHSGTLKDVLAAVPARIDAVIARRENFVPRPRRSGDFFADAMTVRERVAHNFIGGRLPPKMCHRGAADIEVEQGNHVTSRNGVPLEGGAARITVFHYPIRDRQQFIDKVRNAGSGYARNASLSPAVGQAKRHLYDLHLNGKLNAYYDRAVVDFPRLCLGLATGTLVIDRRLQAAFRALRQTPGT
jgi:hypothetical protein